MKINSLDAHDRLTYFTRQDFSISECCQDMLNKRPFGDHPFYIFAHTRTDEDGVTKRLIWQPRLTKPKCQPNSMLFKGYPGTDTVKVIWMIPEPAMWQQFEKGKLTASEIVIVSIYNYMHHREKLEAKEDDDLSDKEIDAIYREMSASANKYKILS